MPYKGGKREKAKLKYDKDVYTPEGAKSLTDKKLRQEYSRLRSIARKRLERFEGTEWVNSQSYLMNKGVYKPLKEINSDRELRHLFSQVAKFVTSETGSVSGLERQRDNAIKTLQDRGYDFVNKRNYRKFAEFMEYARINNLNRMYDSKRLADFYEATEKKNLSNEELQKAFKHWTKNQQKMKKIQNPNPRSSKSYREGLRLE